MGEDIRVKSDFELYDEAVVLYVKNVIPRVVYASTDRASYTIVKNNPKYKDNIPYPFASVYRDPSMPIDWGRYNKSAIKGHFLRLTTSTKTSVRTARYVHSIPVTLTYQVDIWGVRSIDILPLSQKLLLELTVNHPVLYVPINPEGEMGRFHLLDVNLVDNSDIESEESKNRLYRHTYTFTVNAWIKDIKDIERAPWKCPDIVITNDI